MTKKQNKKSKLSRSNSTKTEKLIDHTIGLEEASKILKRPVGTILEYACHGAITIHYIVSHGYYSQFSYFLVKRNKQIEL